MIVPPVLFPIVGFQVHFLDLAEQRVARIAAGALVVKGVLHHLVEGLQEVLLVYAVVLDGLFDADRFFELLDLLDEELQCLCVVLAADTAEVCALGVAPGCAGTGTERRCPSWPEPQRR